MPDGRTRKKHKTSQHKANVPHSKEESNIPANDAKDEEKKMIMKQNKRKGKKKHGQSDNESRIKIHRQRSGVRMSGRDNKEKRNKKAHRISQIARCQHYSSSLLYDGSSTQWEA